MRRACWPLLLLAFWQGNPSLGQAQDPERGERFYRQDRMPLVENNAIPVPESHFLPGDIVPPENLEELLLDRLRQTQNLRDAHSLVQKALKTNDLLKRFNLKAQDIERMRQLALHDPDLARLIEDFRQKRKPEDFERWLKQPQLSEEQLKLFRKLAEKLKRKPDDLPRVLDSKELPATDLKQPNPSVPPGRMTSTEPAASSSGPSERWTEFLTRQLDRLADGLDEMDYPRDSDALRDVVRQLQGAEWSRKDLKLDRFTSGQLEALDQAGRWLSPDALGSVNNWGRWARGSLPALGSLPRFRLPSYSGPALPGLPAAPTLAGAPSLNTLVWLAAAVLLVVLLWKWKAWFQLPQDADAQGRWRLGPWPIAPDQVATRGELIRAFEYLALLLLGPSARSQHHHELAQQIGGPASDSPERREAVERLTRLYEQARYAPEQADANIPLPQDEQAFARQALCMLAGLNPS